MNSNTASFLALPVPCGLAITSVTSDNEFLYALQPDRKTVYKLDACGRIICVFGLNRKYNSIHYCSGGKFFATVDGDRARIYVLNKCFAQTGYIEPNFPCEPVCEDRCTQNSCNSCSSLQSHLFVGPAGTCDTQTACMLTVSDQKNLYAADQNGRIITKLSSAGRNNRYTAIAENNGILFEGLESTQSSANFVRATLLSSGSSKVKRLPFGYKVRSFFCYGGRLYAFITKNSFHAYVAAICVYTSGSMLGGDIIDLPDSPFDQSCVDESCGSCQSSCSKNCSCSSCGVSSNQTEMCSNTIVSGDSTENSDCDVDELCRLFNCIKSLCSRVSGQNCNGCQSACGTNCNCGSNCNSCGSCVLGSTSQNQCPCCSSGNLSCNCYPKCNCTDADSDSTNCLPLPDCVPPECIRPDTKCSCYETKSDLKVTFKAER